MPCTGRIDPLFALKAFEKGADGVLISGCHPGDCHYSEGNYYARRKFELLERMIHHLGIPKERFKWTWVSASEGQRWQKVVTEFVAGVEKLGPSRREGPVSRQDHIREFAAKALADGRVDYFIGWKQGYNRSEVIPAFVKDPAEVDQLIWNPLCHHNLVTFIKRNMPDPTGAKIGVCVKGCDSRTLVALLQEELVDKDKLYVVGVPCDGIVDRRKLEKEFADEMVDIAFPGTGQGGRHHPARGEERICPERRAARCLQPLPLSQPGLLGRHRRPAGARARPRRTCRPTGATSPTTRTSPTTTSRRCWSGSTPPASAASPASTSARCASAGTSA